MRKRWPCLFAFMVALLWVVPAAAGEESEGTPILNTQSFWRVRTGWETVDVVLPDGSVDYVRFVFERGWFNKNKDQVEIPEGDYKIEKVEPVRLPAETSPGWMKSDFDDSSWARVQGPIFDKFGKHRPILNWKAIFMRGRFEVPDPAKAKDLKLSVDFRGGAVVYLNGEELVRKGMPAGDLTPYTAAEPYPMDVYIDDKGFVMWPPDDKEKYEVAAEKRIRHLTDFTVPASKLKKGVNVLAIGFHRSPTPARVFLGRVKRYPLIESKAHWCKVALLNVDLTAQPGSGIAPNVGPVKGQGFLVWNKSIIRRVDPIDYPDPFAPLAPLRLAGVRNGAFSGQLVISDDKPIKGLKVEVTDLAGPGKIPSSAIRVRYPKPDGQPAQRGKLGFFDSLEPSVPAEVPVYEEGDSAVQPVWFTVHVPADAKPGEYKGSVTISAEGEESVSVPLSIKVVGWKLPPSREFVGRMDIVQSPDSVALAYEVEMWSEEHWKLLEKTFELLGQISDKTIYITAIRRTHWGNEHAMIRWSRDEEGELQPEFSIVEKYLDLAVEHLGKDVVVILDCWEPISSMGHAGGAGTAKRTTDKDVMITMWDPESGKLMKRKGPAWGTPESKTFWRKLTVGMEKVMEKRDMADTLLFGLVGDARPTKLAMDDICNGMENARWAVHSHYYCVAWNGYEMGFAIALWGIGCRPVDPAEGYGFGWSNPFWLSYYPREMSMRSTLVEHRVKLERWMGARSRSLGAYAKAAGAKGLGRLGGDFWKVLKNERGVLSATLAGRYPESYWGQLNLNYCISHLLGKGKDGPVATVRSEAFRENLQEVEARIFIERALTDKGLAAELGEDLVGRCRKTLDERIRMCLHSEQEGLAWFVSSGWSERNELLFRLAAEVDAKVGEKLRSMPLIPEPKAETETDPAPTPTPAKKGEEKKAAPEKK